MSDSGNGNLPVYRGGRDIPGLQILKFICAFLVVQLHYASFIKGYLAPVLRIAVPVFFFITGYFLLDAEGKFRSGKVAKMLKKAVALEIAALLIYGAATACQLLRHGKMSLGDIATRWFWLKVDFAAYHLWYMVALIGALAFIYIFVKLKVHKWLYLVVPIGLTLNILQGNYHFLVKDLPTNVGSDALNNVLTMSLPYILVGTLLRKYEHRLPSGKVLWASLAAFLAVGYFESMMLPNASGVLFLSTLPVAAVAFCIFKDLKINGKAGLAIAGLGRNHSAVIYILHILVGTFILLVLDYFGAPAITEIEAFVIFIATLLLSAFIQKIKSSFTSPKQEKQTPGQKESSGS